MAARTREASAERLDASAATGGIANRGLQPEFRHGRCWTLSAYEIWMRSVETQVRWAVSNATAERCNGEAKTCLGETDLAAVLRTWPQRPEALAIPCRV